MGIDSHAAFYTYLVGAALCRERAAERPQDFRVTANIAGAAARPFRDTRPLPQVLYCVRCRRPGLP
ncbi:hypothetical protein CMV24_20120 [Pseudomonas plecoglossicida]|uniref:Uncharacterized protein n=1 Tax=Pseudomonas plecoglossicida TaxID=70775 RepID=A0A0B5KGK5_PSEDL|nr:hypothetical protein RK21_03228 [Pseudomonas plecoglossicida]PBJ93821.1 hypothetical protein CMV24_20120 [Pseudomonas plecoglossicida]